MDATEFNCFTNSSGAEKKGEAGIGKTRLATAFLGWAAANGADILQGRAFEPGNHLPYQPLVESLRNRLERENAPDDLLSDTWLAEISSLLPELRDRYPDLSPPTQTETTAQARLFEAVVRLGQALAERSPVVLFIDDAQWADAASLDLLHYAGRRWQEDNISILLLLNVHIETLLSTLTLARWFSGLERDLHATSLRLGLLTLEDLNQLFEGLANVDEWSIAGQSQRACLEEFSKWLFVETRGQPFYVLETLEVLLERGVLTSHLQNNGKWAIDFEVTVLEHGSLLLRLQEHIILHMTRFVMWYTAKPVRLEDVSFIVVHWMFYRRRRTTRIAHTQQSWHVMH